MQMPRNVRGLVKHAHDLDMAGLFNIKHSIRKPFESPEPDLGRIKNLGVPGRSRAGVLGNVGEGKIDGVQKIKRQIRNPLIQIVINGLFDIDRCPYSALDWLHA